MREHRYHTTTTWTGNNGTGTATYRGYSRNHEVSAPGKPVILGSSDPVFRGDAARYNPEDLLVASLASCHMLAYLHLCADRKVTVVAYVDSAEGQMQESTDGGGSFTRVLLRPQVTIASGSDAKLAHALHHEAHALCFIASSVRFDVECQPQIMVEEGEASVGG